MRTYDRCPSCVDLLKYSIHGISENCIDQDNIEMNLEVELCGEKIWTTLGPELSSDESKKALIVWALYGVKSAGAYLGRLISDCMRHVRYQSCKIESDL